MGANGEVLDSAEIRAASQLLGYTASHNVPMGRYTTYRVAGPAALHINCNDVSSLVRVAEVVHVSQVPTLVVGKGSNLLISDRGFPGLVITLGGTFNKTFINPVDGLVTAGGGVSLSRLSNQCSAVGLQGVQWSIGIPGTLGGAICTNAGCRASNIEKIFGKAIVLDLFTGDSRTWTKEDVGFRFRGSELAAQHVVCVNRPGNSGGSPAWERGWNHGKEANWVQEVSV